MDAVAGSFWGLLWLQLSQAKALALASYLLPSHLPACLGPHQVCEAFF